jgi:hypothetical protein
MAERAIDMRRRLPRPEPAGAGGTGTGSTGTGGAARLHSEPGHPNPYPHRLSVDVDDATYHPLRLLAAEEGCTIVELVRAGITHELEARGK